MGIAELFFIAAGLSMDAFAVSICKGLSMSEMNWKNAVISGLYFGGFQGLMPLIGFLLGFRFSDMIDEFDHWIAFILLALIGANMVKECFGEIKSLDSSFNFKAMLPLAVATSIDALIAGVSFAFLNVSILPVAGFICLFTFVLSVAGIRVGNVFGAKYKSKAEFVGGIILILMGTKILLEHLGVFA